MVVGVAGGAVTGSAACGGAAADLVVAANRYPDVYTNLIGATERDLRLVEVGGAARYGTTTLLRQAGAAHPTPIRVAGRARQVDYGDPAVTWPSITAALEAVRANPQAAADSVAATLAVWAGGDLSLPNAPFILAPDMPSGDDTMTTAAATTAPTAVRIPPIQPLTPTKTWFDAVDANPFHQGLLSGLRAYAHRPVARHQLLLRWAGAAARRSCETLPDGWRLPGGTAGCSAGPRRPGTPPRPPPSIPETLLMGPGVQPNRPSIERRTSDSAVLGPTHRHRGRAQQHRGRRSGRRQCRSAAAAAHTGPQSNRWERQWSAARQPRSGP
jgi:hypothetical protein